MTAKPFAPVIPEMLQPVYDGYCYAPAVIVGRDIHVSGLIGFAADASVPEGLTEQLANIFAHLELILAEAGASLADVYSLTSYHLGDLKGQMPEFIRVKTEKLGAPHPAWTAIGIAELALPGALIEVAASARLPDA
jgi:enamine deaminase RidA (YjgF/YER057c/UK114 family)